MGGLVKRGRRMEVMKEVGKGVNGDLVGVEKNVEGGVRGRELKGGGIDDEEVVVVKWFKGEGRIVRDGGDGCRRSVEVGDEWVRFVGDVVLKGVSIRVVGVISGEGEGFGEEVEEGGGLGIVRRGVVVVVVLVLVVEVGWGI